MVNNSNFNFVVKCYFKILVFQAQTLILLMPLFYDALTTAKYTDDYPAIFLPTVFELNEPTLIGIVTSCKQHFFRKRTINDSQKIHFLNLYD